jgi:hypothetical protein
MQGKPYNTMHQCSAHRFLAISATIYQFITADHALTKLCAAGTR